MVKGEMDFINKQSLWVTQKRASLLKGPGGSGGGGGSGIESLLPSGKLTAYQRLDNTVKLKTQAEQEALRNEVNALTLLPLFVISFDTLTYKMSSLS